MHGQSGQGEYSVKRIPTAVPEKVSVGVAINIRLTVVEVVCVLDDLGRDPAAPVVVKYYVILVNQCALHSDAVDVVIMNTSVGHCGGWWMLGVSAVGGRAGRKK